MLMLRNLAFLIFLLSLGSCMALKSRDKSLQVNELNRTNLGILDGSYSISSNQKGEKSLEDCFFPNSHFDYKNKPDSSARIDIKVLSRRKISVSLFSGGQFLKSNRLRGHVINNSFEFKTRHVRSFFGLMSAYERRRERISLLPGGDISVDGNFNILGFLLIMPFTGAADQVENARFDKR